LYIRSTSDLEPSSIGPLIVLLTAAKGCRIRAGPNREDARFLGPILAVQYSAIPFRAVRFPGGDLRLAVVQIFHNADLLRLCRDGVDRPRLQQLPAGPFQAVLRLERRITRDGMISVDGNLYSVPNSARRRVVEVHNTAHEVRILEADQVIAVHPILDGRGQRRILAGHRSLPPPTNSQTPRNGAAGRARSGDVVALRPLAFYDAVGRRLAANGAAA
jgi:hypothetical protein